MRVSRTTFVWVGMLTGRVAIEKMWANPCPIVSGFMFPQSQNCHALEEKNHCSPKIWAFDAERALDPSQPWMPHAGGPKVITSQVVLSKTRRTIFRISSGMEFNLSRVLFDGKCYLQPTLGESQTQLSQFCGGYINSTTLNVSPYLQLDGTPGPAVKGYICPLGQVCQVRRLKFHWRTMIS